MYRACSSPHLATKEPSQLETTRSLGIKQDSTFVGLNIKGQSRLITPQEQNHNKKEVENDDLKATSSVRFVDERWKQGSWDLNMFVKSGKMDWDAMIAAGRAVMIGFFMAYLVDVLTGLDVVGQTKSLKNIKNLADEATFYDKQWQASWQDQDPASTGLKGPTVEWKRKKVKKKAVKRRAEGSGSRKVGQGRLGKWELGINLNHLIPITETKPQCLTSHHLRAQDLKYCSDLDTVGNLSSLQTLELGSNLILGPIPDSIGRLSSLLVMNLRSNSISGPLPDSLGRLLALEELDISYNEINGTLPRSIGRLTKLQKLNIEHNLLTGIVTEDHFANLTSLVSLRGNANMLRLELMADNWEPSFKLGILTLNSWSLGPKFPYWLQTNLSVLYLGSTEISDNIPRRWSSG
ncbi:hypothetical protein E3N88_12988 [Mikania micrantha]|uniref:Disease resistance R13L4/SHOC-2-like LRR domain-containing protein n=1 Tax=Mikania micrantha TaxID=192012 RepID=A0A5N6P8D3_9ASTR|nr:hypothetical protein E3N88_12988 [Mikania micrantha]